MKDTADQVARWLGIFGSGVLDGEDAERSLARASQVLGEARVAELRAWFEQCSPEHAEDTKRAVIEACVAIVHADKVVEEHEVALIGRMVQLAGLPAQTAKELLGELGRPSALSEVAPRITHPALRELVLVMAWQIASADGRIEDAERGMYGELAKRLEVEPARAKELRGLFDGL